MQLSAEEIAVLRQGDRLEVDVPEVGGRCFIVRQADVMKLISLSTDVPTMTTVSQLVDAALAGDDADDPWLSSYQSCSR